MHHQRSAKCSKWNNISSNETLAQESDIGHAQSHAANNESNGMGDVAYLIQELMNML